MELSLRIHNNYIDFQLEFRNNKMIDKAELKKKYKETPRPMGLYKITNTVNGKIFIGRHKNIEGRINRHKFELQHGFEPITELQEDYNKYGLESFSFDILDKLEPKDDPLYDYTEDLEVLEELWLQKLQPYGEKGYNTKK